MSRPDFDEPTKNSLLEAQDYWQNALEFAISQQNKEEITIARENLKDVVERLKEFDESMEKLYNFWHGITEPNGEIGY